MGLANTTHLFHSINFNSKKSLVQTHCSPAHSRADLRPAISLEGYGCEAVRGACNLERFLVFEFEFGFCFSDGCCLAFCLGVFLVFLPQLVPHFMHSGFKHVASE